MKSNKQIIEEVMENEDFKKLMFGISPFYRGCLLRALNSALKQKDAEIRKLKEDIEIIRFANKWGVN